jgi:hypothetical protein
LPRDDSDAIGSPDRELLDIEAVEERIQQALHRRDVRARVSGVVAPLLTLVILLIVWEAVVRLFRVPLYSSRDQPRWSKSWA